jgi:hypothetical protein
MWPRHIYACNIRGCIQKFPDWVDNEICAYKNKNSLRSNAKGYGSKTHLTDSQNSDTTAPNGREPYHSQFSLQATSPETFGYTLLYKRTQSLSWFVPCHGLTINRPPIVFSLHSDLYYSDWLRAGRSRFRGSIAGGGWELFFLRRVQTGSGAQPASYPMGAGVSLP